MQIKDLRPNPKNPRRITEDRLRMLKAALDEFGDLGGIVFNRTSKMLVGGHRRAEVIPPNAEIKIEKKYSRPTQAGTNAEGYVLLNGERFKYREVKWDKITERAANLAANKGAGDWDEPLLSEFLRDIDFNGVGFDLELTMFGKDELEDLLVPTMLPKGKEGAPGKAPKRRTVVCPACDCEFTPAPRV